MTYHYIRSSWHRPRGADRADPGRPRRSNAEMMLDAARLGYLGDGFDHVIDLTYGHGAFWSIVRPPHLTGLDIEPGKSPGGTLRSPYISFDFTDQSDERTLVDSIRYSRFHRGQGVAAVVLDVPYKLSGASHDRAADEPYGVHGEFRPVHSILELTAEGCRTARRLVDPGGHVIVKLQDQTNSGSRQRLTQMAAGWMLDPGGRGRFEHVDDLHVFGYRKQPRGRRQERSHIDHSVALVFQRQR